MDQRPIVMRPALGAADAPRPAAPPSAAASSAALFVKAGAAGKPAAGPAAGRAPLGQLSGNAAQARAALPPGVGGKLGLAPAAAAKGRAPMMDAGAGAGRAAKKDLQDMFRRLSVSGPVKLRGEGGGGAENDESLAPPARPARAPASSAPASAAAPAAAYSAAILNIGRAALPVAPGAALPPKPALHAPAPAPAAAPSLFVPRSSLVPPPPPPPAPARTLEPFRPASASALLPSVRAAPAARLPPPPPPPAPQPAPAAARQRTVSVPLPRPPPAPQPAPPASTPAPAEDAALPPAAEAAPEAPAPTLPAPGDSVPAPTEASIEPPPAVPPAPATAPATAPAPSLLSAAAARLAESRARAEELKARGDITAALAAFRELAFECPQDPSFKAEVEALRRELRSRAAGSTAAMPARDPVEEDPLAAALRGVGAPSGPSSASEGAEQPAPSASSEPVEGSQASQPPRSEGASPAAQSAPAAAPAAPEGAASAEPSDADEVVERALVQVSMAKLEAPVKAAAMALLNVAQLYARFEQDYGAPKESPGPAGVRFRAFDACSTVEPARSDAGVDAAADAALATMQACAKAGDAAARLLAKMPREQADLARAELGRALGPSPVGAFLSCSSVLAASLPCGCAAAPALQGEAAQTWCPRTWARAPRSRASELLSSSLRFCMRRAFNASGLALASNTGSYRYNADDVAAVLHNALLLLDTRRALVESVVLGLSRKAAPAREEAAEEEEEAHEAARVGEFVEAHKFLSSLFPTETACQALVDADRETWARIRRNLAVARELKCEDELALAPLAALPRLVLKLQELAHVVAAARVYLDAHARKAASQRGVVECKCAGARRRRAAEQGTWLAPTLVRGASGPAPRVCGECRAQVPEKGASTITCECCEVTFHLACLRLPEGYVLDFTCRNCVGVPKPAVAAAAAGRSGAAKGGEEDEDDASGVAS